MKKRAIRMAAMLLAAILFFPGQAQAVSVAARSAVLYDADSGTVLFEKNADEQSLIASTTKIMTALVVLEHCRLDDQVEVPAEAAGIEGSSMYLKTGEKLTVRDLLYGMMLSSGNDAAVALALMTSGSLGDFVALMNEKAAELGLQRTHFANPNGLDDAENYATARSLAVLGAAAMQNAEFRSIVSAKSYACEGHSLQNHNKLLWQYEGAVGVKTGFTKQAGRILVGSATRDDRTLLSVTIDDPRDWADHRALLDYGFSCYTQTQVVCAGDSFGAVPVCSGTQAEAPVEAAEGFAYPLLPGEAVRVQADVAPFCYAPVYAGDAAGTARLYLGERCIGTVPLRYPQSVSEEPESPGLWEQILEKLGR